VTPSIWPDSRLTCPTKVVQTTGLAMSINDPIVKAVIGIAFVVLFAGIFWASSWAGRRGRNEAEQFARKRYAPRGFAIQADGGIQWNVVATGQVEGHTVIIEWGHTGSPRTGVRIKSWTEVSIALPSVPAAFGLEVGPKGVVASNPEVPLATHDATFDAAFRGWTDHPDLAPRLLTPEVRRGLFELRDMPELKLSALTSKYRRPQEHRPPRAVSITVDGPGLDPELINRLTRVGIGFADAAAQVFRASPRPISPR
jgi:hypothetical protein